MTTPGRTLRLLRSVKGIGSRTTSPLEKLIENVVVGVLPGSGQSFFAKLQPSAPFNVLAAGGAAVNGHPDMGFLRQRQPPWKLQHPVFINGLDGCRHGQRLPSVRRSGKP